MGCTFYLFKEDRNLLFSFPTSSKIHSISMKIHMNLLYLVNSALYKLIGLKEKLCL